MPDDLEAELKAYLKGEKLDRSTGVRKSDDPNDESKRYQAISRVRSRIREELPEDIAVLSEHHPELFNEFRKTACDNE
ncbi:hypothetical protein HUG10_14455 [Halorarum halophilum]|uniref:Uncharacterized protein n=1 Tax=Halorarum halophilum TaxID=2743090 RepID=A0A7D5L310_9EURY|nr:hypothetical protein HUG10_14455 [Halobaculum halophilum]